MAIKGWHETATKHDAIAHIMAIRPGALGVPDGIEESAALRGDGKCRRGRWQGRGKICQAADRSWLR